VRLGDEVAADSPLQIEIEAFCLEIFPFVKEDGDFFGFIECRLSVYAQFSVILIDVLNVFD